MKRYQSTPEAADYLGVSQSFLEKARVAGTGPAFLKAGAMVRYAVEDLDAWLLSSRRQSTAEAARTAHSAA